MKHLKLLLTLSIISLLAVWSLATIEVQTTTPKVNPDGTSEIVGTFRMIFSNEEFGNPLSADTEFYVIVRIQLADGVQLKTIGEHEPDDVTCADPIILAVEADAGFPGFPTWEPNIFEIVRFTGDFVDIRCTRNMFAAPWSLDITNRVRVTIGTGPDETPTQDLGPFSNMAQYAQEDTRLCCNFLVATRDFLYSDFWKVGMITKNSNASCDMRTTYNVNYQPSDPSLAQKGQAGDTCDLQYDWPCKNEPCQPGVMVGELWYPYIQTCNNFLNWEPDCPGYIPGQGAEQYCDEENETYPQFMDFGPPENGHIFAILEHCTVGDFFFEAGGSIQITLNEAEVDGCDLGLAFAAGGARWWIGGNGMAHPVELTGCAPPTYTDGTLVLTIPETCGAYTFAPDRTKPYCIMVLLPDIGFDACCLITLPEDECLDITVKVEYEPPDFVCGQTPTPIAALKVACLWGCEEVEPEPVEVPLPMWFPYLPPIDNPAITWWGGVAITNYADQATEGGIIYLFDETGAMATVAVPPLGGHEMWLRLMDDWTVEPVDAGFDTTRSFSAILVTTVIYPDYWIETGTDFLHFWAAWGTMAGLDAFVLMGDGNEAYGYTARVMVGPWYWNNGPGWNKANKGK